MYLDLDGAWGDEVLGLPRADARAWGPRLRCFGRTADVAPFDREVCGGLPPFVLYGSGDFHHLAGLFVGRAVQRAGGPVTVVSFDNHPDWDVRPPRWACGGWVNRALDLPGVRRVSVWGCGNFELAWPHRLFANRVALRAGRLEVHAWGERQSPAVRRRFACMGRDDWRGRFEAMADGLRGAAVYVTVDLDCLRAGEAVTNWENGLFTAGDVAWAVRRLRDAARVVGGDVCGAYSPPVYARRLQRFAAEWDRPKVGTPDLLEARCVNGAAMGAIWPALTGGD